MELQTLFAHTSIGYDAMQIEFGYTCIGFICRGIKWIQKQDMIM